MKNALSVCVVDDEPSNRSTMGMMLRAMGFEKIHEFSNAPEALHFIQENATHLIVSDWNMEPMSGLELLNEVRSNRTLTGIPFVMVTANKSENYWCDAIMAGVSEFLFKPYSFSAFRGAVLTGLGLENRSDGVLPINSRVA